jgi:hypothetical protein
MYACIYTKSSSVKLFTQSTTKKTIVIVQMIWKMMIKNDHDVINHYENRKLDINPHINIYMYIYIDIYTYVHIHIYT